MGDYFRIEPDVIRRAAGNLPEAGTLRQIAQEAGEIASNPAFHGAGRQEVTRALGTVSENIERQSVYTENLAESLASIADRYLQAERRVCELGSGIRPSQAKSVSKGTAAGKTRTDGYSAADVAGASSSPAAVPGSSLGTDRRCSAYSSDPVNLCTGNLVWQDTDLAEGMPGLLRLRRTYNAMSARIGWFGRGWQCEWETSLKKAGGDTFLLLRPDGSITTEKQGQTVEVYEDRYLCQAQGDVLYQFDAKGQLQSVHRNGGTLSIIRSLPEDKESQKVLIRSMSSENSCIRLLLEGGLVRQAELCAEADGTKEQRQLSFAYQTASDQKTFLLTGVMCGSNLLHRYRYNGSDLLSEIAGADDGWIVRNFYDTAGRACLQQFPDQTSLAYSYDEEGYATVLKERDGRRIRCEYDTLYRKLCVQDGMKAFLYTYDRENRRTAVYRGTDERTDYQYDDAGRITKIRSGSKLACFSYKDIVKLPERIDFYDAETAGTCIRFTYDRSGNISKAVLRNGVQYDFDYDRQNHLTKVTRENRVLCRISYDDGGRISRILEEDGSATAYRYTPSGVLKEIRDRSDLVYHFTLQDETGRVKEMTRSDGASWTYRYDREGRLEAVTDGGGEVFTKTGVPAGAGFGTAVLDQSGKLISLEDKRGKYTWSRDEEGRPVFESRPDGVRVSRSFEPGGKLHSVKVKMPDGKAHTVIYHYEDCSAGRVLSLIRVKDQEIRFSYDEAGRITQKQFPGGIREQYVYQPDGILAKVIHKLDGEVFHTISCTRDKRGRIDRRITETGTEPAKEYRYSYDACNRLIAEGGHTYRYDPYGNRISDTQYNYDEDGNVTAIHDGSGRELAVRYTDRGFPEEISGKCVGTGDEIFSTSCVTDALGCRVRQIITLNNEILELQNLYDTSVYPPRLIRRRITGSGAADLFEITYLWEHVPLLMRVNGVCFYYLSDGMGNISLLADADGKITESFEGSVFHPDSVYAGANIHGTDIPEKLWKLIQPFAPCCYERDPFSGLWHSYFRDYDPEEGQFISPDRCSPLKKLPIPANRYAWCFSDPVNFRDYDGRWPHLPSPAAIWNGIMDAGSAVVDGATAAWNYLCGSEQKIYEIAAGGVTYSVSDHTGGGVFVSNYDQYGNYKGWVINASFKIPFTDISLKAGLSGESLNPLTWGIYQSVRFGQGNGETSGYTSYKMTVDANGISWKAETGGSYDSIPIPLPGGTTIDSETELKWAAAVSSGGINWYQFAGAVACAGAAAAVAVIMLDDGTGLGVLDDGLIPVLTGFLGEYAVSLGDVFPALAVAGCGG